MRIQGPHTPPAIERTQSTEAAAAASSVSRTSDAAVVVGSRAAEVNAAAEKSSAAHAERLSSIAAALADGSYQVDHGRIADAMIADELGRRGVG